MTKEERKTHNKKYYSEHKEWYRQYHLRNKDKINAVSNRNNRIYRYGLSKETYNSLFELQNGCCVICGKHQSCFKRSLHIDHNHSTGKVRGLLCHNCNMMLGFAKDNTDTLKNAITYLEIYN